MLKKAFAVLLFALCMQSLSLFAQPHIERSASFEAPDDEGYMNVMQFKNGKTCYLSFVGEGGISFKLFDATHKQVVSTKIKSDKWDGDDYNTTAISATYEISGELVIFLLQQQDKNDINLYRIRVDEETGKIIKEDQLGTEHKSMLIPFSFYIAGFIVQKDPYSDCYGIITSQMKIGSLKCAVQHYDGSHKLITSCPLYAKGEETLYPIGIAVNGDKAVYIAAAALISATEMGRCFVAKMDKGSTAANYTLLDYTEDFKSPACQLRYDKVNDKLQVLTTSFVSSKMFGHKSVYSSSIAVVNPATLAVLSVKEISNQKVNEFARNTMAKEEEFNGVCNGFLTNNKNEIFLLNEEMAFESRSGVGVSSTTLGNIGITRLNDKYEETDGYLIERNQKVDGAVPMMFLADVGKGSWFKPSYRMQVASTKEVKFLFVNGATSNYILINDFDIYVRNGNTESMKKKDFRNATVQASLYTIKNGNMTKAFVFDNVVPGTDHTCYIGAADISKQGVIATIELTSEGKKDKANLVWITLE